MLYAQQFRRSESDAQAELCFTVSINCDCFPSYTVCPKLRFLLQKDNDTNSGPKVSRISAVAVKPNANIKNKGELLVGNADAMEVGRA